MVTDDRPVKTVRAAQYVRMSTDNQKYSTQNQADAIAAYAAQKGMEIVRTYADEGCSGLSIAGRESLRRMIEDVRSGSADYDVILVYDISRWGRFQDADESAYYEFICRQAGITVHYCAEQFENDGSLSATLIKSVKRVMAGEYSRELSTKVFAGQCRLITLGYRQGGPAGYGLRRFLVDEHNERKAPLERGEQKSLQTDRVILVPGPPAEVETVRRIYRVFVLQRRSEREIAILLNDERIDTGLGHGWTRGIVHQILTNEKYIGNNVYNRVSFKLKRKRVANPPDMWVRGDGAFEAIVDADFFEAAQHIVAERSRRFTDEQLLTMLRDFQLRKGALSGLVIDEDEDMPSSSAYRHRFGSLVKAYSLIGYDPGRDYRYLETNRALRLMHPGIVADTAAEIERIGGAVAVDPATDLMRVNDEFSVSLVLARCFETAGGSRRWKIRLDAGLAPDITVAVRMSPGNERPRDYYLLPWIDLGGNDALRLADENGTRLDAYRADDLGPLYHLSRRFRLGHAA
ncbi:recombinase family protein [Sphingomonas oryzagri]|uniref:Recombinase family protein n=1 Tax=Sphingomonas oryzagri TaxID=3042314 RepID=A0ABT6N4Q4_9SPHN|nr:recombinase family protein [Sphingomonas oryzagri]MDH7639964.1 recombinase family protein [Sphingomonas oryzagri]